MSGKMKKFANMVSKIVLPLTEDLHKGQAGRICVIGGCKLYTGAPYYASISSLRTGGDLAFVLCSEEATIMKSYSPEPMIYPLFEEGTLKSELKDIEAELEKILARSHVLVIGPGLGRDLVMFSQVELAIKIAKKKNMGMVIDGDGLYFVAKNPDLVKGYENCILTPNVREYAQISKKVLPKDIQSKISKGELDQEDEIKEICGALGGVTIVKKGKEDLICNGEKVYEITSIARASLRRCGGQGDILAGSLGVFLWWSSLASTYPLATEEHKDLKQKERTNRILAAMGACLLTRHAASLGFAKLKRGLTCPEIISCVPKAFEELYGE